jgi:hypothetical protein
VTRVELNIEELALHGFPVGDRDVIGAALRERLGALLRTAAPQWSDRTDVSACAFTPGATPQATGARIADAVYGGLFR